jgi:hypothetical protein
MLSEAGDLMVGTEVHTHRKPRTTENQKAQENLAMR